MESFKQILLVLTDHGFIILLLAGLSFFALYFLPSIVAGIRHKRNTLAIFFLNLFAGWTGIRWLIALIWTALYERIDTTT
jgi:hypothetical protein